MHPHRAVPHRDLPNRLELLQEDVADAVAAGARFPSLWSAAEALALAAVAAGASTLALALSWSADRGVCIEVTDDGLPPPLLLPGVTGAAVLQARAAAHAASPADDRAAAALGALPALCTACEVHMATAADTGTVTQVPSLARVAAAAAGGAALRLPPTGGRGVVTVRLSGLFSPLPVRLRGMLAFTDSHPSSPSPLPCGLKPALVQELAAAASRFALAHPHLALRLDVAAGGTAGSASAPPACLLALPPPALLSSSLVAVSPSAAQGMATRVAARCTQLWGSILPPGAFTDPATQLSIPLPWWRRASLGGLLQLHVSGAVAVAVPPPAAVAAAIASGSSALLGPALLPHRSKEVQVLAVEGTVLPPAATLLASTVTASRSSTTTSPVSFYTAVADRLASAWAAAAAAAAATLPPGLHLAPYAPSETGRSDGAGAGPFRRRVAVTARDAAAEAAGHLSFALVFTWLPAVSAGSEEADEVEEPLVLLRDGPTGAVVVAPQAQELLAAVQAGAETAFARAFSGVMAAAEAVIANTAAAVVARRNAAPPPAKVEAVAAAPAGPPLPAPRLPLTFGGALPRTARATALGPADLAIPAAYAGAEEEGEPWVLPSYGAALSGQMEGGSWPHAPMTGLAKWRALAAGAGDAGCAVCVPAPTLGASTATGPQPLLPSSLTGGVTVTRAALSSLIPLGQLDAKYLLTALPDATAPSSPSSSLPASLVIVDQHAAHERIRLEMLEAALFAHNGGQAPEACGSRYRVSQDGMVVELLSGKEEAEDEGDTAAASAPPFVPDGCAWTRDAATGEAYVAWAGPRDGLGHPSLGQATVAAALPSHPAIAVVTWPPSGFETNEQLGEPTPPLLSLPPPLPPSSSRDACPCASVHERVTGPDPFDTYTPRSRGGGPVFIRLTPREAAAVVSYSSVLAAWGIGLRPASSSGSGEGGNKAAASASSSSSSAGSAAPWVSPAPPLAATLSKSSSMPVSAAASPSLAAAAAAAASGWGSRRGRRGHSSAAPADAAASVWLSPAAALGSASQTQSNTAVAAGSSLASLWRPVTGCGGPLRPSYLSNTVQGRGTPAAAVPSVCSSHAASTSCTCCSDAAPAASASPAAHVPRGGSWEVTALPRILGSSFTLTDALDFLGWLALPDSPAAAAVTGARRAPCRQGADATAATAATTAEAAAPASSSDCFRARLFQAGARPPAVIRILHSKACRGAVMFGTRLDPSSVGALVAGLAECALPFNCAHGRPSLVPLLRLVRPPSLAVAELGDEHSPTGAAKAALLRGVRLVEL